ncbi:MAG: Crp/Fnr family transcriptional regulator [Selenomonadaceae bacterium]|nr:Crp/Fnr family transcriptional regulator [Selenomonadaceae bacterium]MBP3722097.1 Crp/Fnr family transcriptional regulator [Selenomonadaceae bacterium]
MNFAELALFSGLNNDEVDVFVKNTKGYVNNYDKGDFVLKPYEPNSNIGVLLEGKAEVITEDRFGNEFIGHSLERGALLGSASAILSEEYSPEAIRALTKLSALWIPYRSLITAGPKLGRIHGIVMKNLLEAFCTDKVLLMEKLNLLSQKSLRERLILYLLQKERRYGTEKVVVPGRIQLAKELECNRSALTREISLMKDDGILIEGADWMRLDKNKLE